MQRYHAKRFDANISFIFFGGGIEQKKGVTPPLFICDICEEIQVNN